MCDTNDNWGQFPTDRLLLSPHQAPGINYQLWQHLLVTAKRCKHAFLFESRIELAMMLVFSIAYAN